MAETILIDAATVTAGSTCAVVAYAVAGETADPFVDFRIDCSQSHTVRFYAAEETFSAITSAALLINETRTGLAATTGTTGNLFIVDPGVSEYVACVVTNEGSSSATVTVAAE